MEHNGKRIAGTISSIILVPISLPAYPLKEMMVFIVEIQ